MEEVKKTVKGIRCPKCLQAIWSKHRHDYHFCDCGYCSVDGGRDYLRYGWGNNKYPEEEWVRPEEVEIEVI